jgi:predicted amidophosphoribosyltransferase
VLENRTGIPAVRCLRKTKHTPPQSTLQGEAQRKANVLGVYQPVHPSVFAGKTVLLLDDIITTGATISECAKTLMLAGAKEVYCAAIASAAKNHK